MKVSVLQEYFAHKAHDRQHAVVSLPASSTLSNWSLRSVSEVEPAATWSKNQEEASPVSMASLARWNEFSSFL